MEASVANDMSIFRGPMPMLQSRVIVALVPAYAALLLAGSPLQAADDKSAPEQVFEKRIMPIFKSPNPSSCTQCHLSGVDLKNYILPSSEKTFLSLRDQGLVDLQKPENSKILHLINMNEADKSRREPHPREDAQGRIRGVRRMDQGLRQRSETAAIAETRRQGSRQAGKTRRSDSPCPQGSAAGIVRAKCVGDALPLHELPHRRLGGE